MNRVLAVAPALVIVALVALFASFSLRRDPHVLPHALVGKPVPDLVLPPLSGGQAEDLPALIHGPALVNFYASWCAPCADEAPALMALKAEGVRIIGIAYKDSPQDASAFLARFGDPYQATLVDRDGRGGVEFGVTGVPETYAVDGRGLIRDKRAPPPTLTPGGAESMLQEAAR